MLNINLNVDDKEVLIIGGGKKALQVGEKFNNVKYLSPNFIDEIDEDLRIYKNYEKEDVDNAILVVAASVKKELNQQVVLDCKEKNILCGSINNDENVSFHFQRDFDYEFLHFSYQTKDTSPTYYEILDEEFEGVYRKHEPFLKDLKVIYDYALEHIEKYSRRNEIIDTIIHKDPKKVHAMIDLMNSDIEKMVVFDGPMTKDNIQIVENFVSTFEKPFPFMFKDEDILEMCQLLELKVEFIPVSLDLIEYDEWITWLRHTPYNYYIFNKDISLIKKKLSRCFKAFHVEDEIPDIRKSTCICTMLRDEIEINCSNLVLECMSLLENESFVALLKTKLENIL